MSLGVGKFILACLKKEEHKIHRCEETSTCEKWEGRRWRDDARDKICINCSLFEVLTYEKWSKVYPFPIDDESYVFVGKFHWGADALSHLDEFYQPEGDDIFVHEESGVRLTDVFVWIKRGTSIQWKDYYWTARDGVVRSIHREFKGI